MPRIALPDRSALGTHRKQSITVQACCPSRHLSTVHPTRVYCIAPCFAGRHLSTVHPTRVYCIAPCFAGMLQPCSSVCLYTALRDTSAHTEGYIAIPRLSLFKRVVPADNIVLYVLHESTILPCFAGMLQPFLFDCSSV